ncbi:MAG: hypothetical protein K940chlam2_00718 [Chlamydiae bacterium]|nr:hypothetical protein [Chlamydiota bacterium]
MDSSPLAAQNGPLLNALYGSERLLPAGGEDLLSCNAMGAQFVLGDYSSIYRSGSDLVGVFVPHGGVGAVQAGTLVGYHAYGTASGLNTFMALLSFKADFANLAYSEAIGDSRGALVGRAGIAKDVVFAGSGAAFLPYRIMSIICSTQGISGGFNSVSLLGRVSTGFAYAGMVFYTAFFALLAFGFGMNIYEGEKLRNKLKGSGDLASQIETLFKKLDVDPAKIEARFSEEELREGALKVGVETIKALLKEMGVDEPSEAKLRGAVEKLVESSYGAENGSKELAKRGVEIRAELLAQKKTAKLQRALGSAALTELRAARDSGDDLAGRIRKGDAGAIKMGQALVDKMYAGMNKTRLVFGASVGVCLFGIATMVAIMVLTGGIGAIVALAMMLVFSVAMLGVDGYFLKESYASEEGAPMDKPLLIGSSVLCLASLGSVLALAVAGVIALGPFSIAVLALLTVLWLGQNGLTWKNLDKKEDRKKLESPTLESYLEALGAGDVDTRLEQMFKNLPSELQERITAELKQAEGATESEQRACAVKAAIEGVERLREDELEALRGILIPLLIS